MKGLLGASLREHWQRYIATAVAIMLATGFTLTCLAVAGGFNQAIERSIAGRTRGADVVVSTDYSAQMGDSGAKPSELHLSDFVKKAAGDPLIETTRELEFVPISLIKGSARSYVQVSDVPPEPFQRTALTEGRYPQTANEITLDASVASTLGVKVGDTVEVEVYPDHVDPVKDPETGELTYPDPEPTDYKLKVTGMSAGTVNIFSSVYVNHDFYQKIHPHIDLDSGATVILYIAKNRDAQALQASLQKINENHEYPVSVQTQPDYVSKQLDQYVGGTSVLTVMLLIFPAIAVVTAIIVISVTFQVLLAQRKRELALLRAIGATKRQIRRLVLREALLVGLVSSILGVAVGAGFGTFANFYSGLVIETREAIAAISPWYILGTIAVGLVMTLLGSLAPSRRIAKVSPMEALHPEDSVYVKRRRAVARAIIGILLTLAGAAAIVIGLLTKVDFHNTNPGDNSAIIRFAAIFFGSLVSFLGALLLLTLLTPRITALVGKLVGKKSVITEIAGENTLRNPARTGATVTALTMGITLVATMLVGSTSMSATISGKLDETAPVDFWVTSSKTLSKDTISTLKESHGVSAVTVGDTLTAKIPALKKVKINGDEVSRGTEVFQLHSVANLKARGKLSAPTDGELWMSSYWMDDSWGKDTKIPVTVGNVTLQLHPVASNLPDISVSAKTLARLSAGIPSVPEAERTARVEKNETFRDSDTGKAYYEEVTVLPVGQHATGNIAYILMRDDATTSDVTALGSRLADSDETALQGPGPVRILAMQILQALTIGIVAMLAISVLVALVGVANTLALSVVERRRENAVLRAVGMTRRGMKGMLAAEALLIGGVGAIVGIGLGILYGWLGMKSLPLDLSSATADRDTFLLVFDVPWLQLGVVLLIAVGAAVAASWLPGRAAAKAAPVEALAEAAE